MKKRCGNCGKEGHEVRMCNEEMLNEERKEIFEKIKRRRTEEEIMEYARGKGYERMRLITYKTPEGKLTRIGKLTEKEEQYYENLKKYIKQENEKQKEQLAKLLEKKIKIMRRMGILHMLDHQAMYIQYVETLGQHIEEVREMISSESYPSEEIQALGEVNETTINRLLDRDLHGLSQFIHVRRLARPIQTTYETMTLWLGYIVLIIQAYTPPKPPNYNFVKRLIENISNETMECPICMESITTPEISEVNCGHKFCRTCIRTTIQRHPKHTRCGCPLCRRPIEKIIRCYNLV